jgi:hypothetical protein
MVTLNSYFLNGHKYLVLFMYNKLMIDILKIPSFLLKEKVQNASR